MDIFSKPKSQKALDDEILRLTETLSKMSPTENEYSKIADNLKVLCAARGVKPEGGISPDVIVSAVVNILAVLLVLNYEKAGVVTSKAFSFLGRKV